MTFLMVYLTMSTYCTAVHSAHKCNIVDKRPTVKSRKATSYRFIARHNGHTTQFTSRGVEDFLIYHGISLHSNYFSSYSTKSSHFLHKDSNDCDHHQVLSGYEYSDLP